ncbi:MAG: phosphotransferase, partial [Paludibacteraceae bacterium]|nr:phosphotransferase [Paludibacteraceae bacterium]
LTRTIRRLAHIQIEGARDMDWSVCYPVPAFDRKSIFWDLNYFKYDFLKLTGIDFSEPELEADFEHLADELLSVPCDAFMYRDFQSRNVMIYQNEPYFIDFQGGRRGPIYYDLASFLWQAKANFPQSLRDQLLNAYFDELEKINHKSQIINHKSQIKTFVLFRLLQVLGAYGFRGLIEHKQHFIESIPFAIKNLSELFTLNPDLQSAYPYIYTLSKSLIIREASERLARDKGDSTLTIDILSFSFKKGLPSDPSGNGGGYIFDCRSTHNPGKYDEYKQLTGLDKPVIEFLESDGEILTFLDSVYQLVDHHVERFLERGFTHLQVAFGCTGGQHRSVYSAEATARHIRNKYPEANVCVQHRELNIKH